MRLQIFALDFSSSVLAFSYFSAYLILSFPIHRSHFQMSFLLTKMHPALSFSSRFPPGKKKYRLRVLETKERVLNCRVIITYIAMDVGQFPCL